jgi:hypothetical protein
VSTSITHQPRANTEKAKNIWENELDELGVKALEIFKSTSQQTYHENAEQKTKMAAYNY